MMNEQDQTKPAAEFFGVADPYPIARSVRAGDFVFTSTFGDRVMTADDTTYDAAGQPNRTGKRTSQSFEDEVHGTFRAISEALKLAGAGLADVVDCQVHLRDPRDFFAMNRIYATYFFDNQPVRSVMQNCFMFDFRIEIKVTAYCPG